MTHTEGRVNEGSVHGQGSVDTKLDMSSDRFYLP